MQKKNKLMLAAAIGMVAIVVGSTAVRCSVAHTIEERAEPAGTGAAVESTVQAQDAGQSAQGAPGEDATAEIVALLRANAWQAEGAPERTLAFREGSFVESDGTSVRLTAFEVKGSGETDPASRGQRDHGARHRHHARGRPLRDTDHAHRR